MSYTNISLADLQFEIEEKDLYIKQRELISQTTVTEEVLDPEDEVLETNDNNLIESSFNEESIHEEEKQEEIEEIKVSLRKSLSVVTIQSRFKEYQNECLKYMISPLSRLATIGEITQLNFACLTLGDFHIRIILNHLLDYNLMQLTHLDLSKNPLTPCTCEILANYIMTNANLSHLVLSECWIGLEGVEKLSDALAYSTSLKYINLSKCDLNDAGGVTVVAAMQINDLCQILDLGHNKLSSQTAAKLEELLAEKETLETLILNWNEFYPEKESIVKIMKGLERNQSLRELNLAWNGITGSVFTKFLMKALKGNQSLETLNLDFNLLKGDDITGLVKAVQKSQSLRNLSLKGNPFTREDALKLLDIFEEPSNLKMLEFGTEFWHNDNFLTKIKDILQRNPELQINYQPMRIKKSPKKVKLKSIIVDRIHFLSTKAINGKKKKKRWDFADFMHDIIDKKQEQQGEEQVIDKAEFYKVILENRYKIPKETIDHLMDEFSRVIPSSNAKRKPKTKVDLLQMSEYYLNRFKLPPRVKEAPKEKAKKSSKAKKGKRSKPSHK